MSLLTFFARVRGIADGNKMSENLNKAKVDFRREMNALSEKSISNASARIVSVPRRFELRGSLIRHLPLHTYMPHLQAEFEVGVANVSAAVDDNVDVDIDN